MKLTSILDYTKFVHYDVFPVHTLSINNSPIIFSRDDPFKTMNSLIGLYCLNPFTFVYGFANEINLMIYVYTFSGNTATLVYSIQVFAASIDAFFPVVTSNQDSTYRVACYYASRAISSILYYHDFTSATSIKLYQLTPTTDRIVSINYTSSSNIILFSTLSGKIYALSNTRVLTLIFSLPTPKEIIQVTTIGSFLVFSYNHVIYIKPKNSNNKLVIAGNGVFNYTSGGDGGPLTQVTFNNIKKLQFDRDTNVLYIHDNYNGRYIPVSLCIPRQSIPRSIDELTRIGDIYVTYDQFNAVGGPRLTVSSLLGQVYINLIIQSSTSIYCTNFTLITTNIYRFNFLYNSVLYTGVINVLTDSIILNLDIIYRFERIIQP